MKDFLHEMLESAKATRAATVRVWSTGDADERKKPRSANVQRKPLASFVTPERIGEMHAAGMSHQQIANELGISLSTVQTRYRAFREARDMPGLRKKRTFTDEQVMTLLNQGRSHGQIARELGVSRSSVSGRIRMWGQG